MKILNKIIPYLFLAFGLIIFLHPMLLDTGKLPGDIGDASFINYVLEHGYQWLTGNKLHSSFWDMPIFYPHDNSLAFSDMMIGGMLIYTPIRMFISSPQTALQLWLTIACILNYVAFWILMRKTFKFGNSESSIAAFLFAFGLPRHLQICHLQLMLQFFSIFYFYAFTQIKNENTPLKNNILFLTGSALFVLQLYTTFYFGWFTVFGGLIALFICLIYKNTRDKIFYIIKTYWKEVILSGIISIILLIPLVYHYLAVNSQFGWTPVYLLKFFSFLKSESMLDEFIWHNPFRSNCEAYTGIGFITSIFVLIGICRSKYWFEMLLFLFLTGMFFENCEWNHALYKYFPGASAIRAGGRVVFLMLPVFAWGIANFFKHLNKRSIITIAAIIFLIEQIPFVHGYDWTKTIHNQRLQTINIPKECKVVYYNIKATPKYKYLLDIMWKAHYENIYTANGYSGYMPEYIPGTVPKNCVFTIEDKN